MVQRRGVYPQCDVGRKIGGEIRGKKQADLLKAHLFHLIYSCSSSVLER